MNKSKQKIKQKIKKSTNFLKMYSILLIISIGIVYAFSSSYEVTLAWISTVGLGYLTAFAYTYLEFLDYKDAILQELLDLQEIIDFKENHPKTFILKRRHKE